MQKVLEDIFISDSIITANYVLKTFEIKLKRSIPLSTVLEQTILHTVFDIGMNQ